MGPTVVLLLLFLNIFLVFVAIRRERERGNQQSKMGLRIVECAIGSLVYSTQKATAIGSIRYEWVSSAGLTDICTERLMVGQNGQFFIWSSRQTKGFLYPFLDTNMGSVEDSLRPVSTKEASRWCFNNKISHNQHALPALTIA